MDSPSVASFPSPLYCVLSHLIGTVVTVTLKDGRYISGLLSYETLLQMDKRMLLVDLGKDNTGNLHFETVRIALEKVQSIKGQAALKSGPLVSTSFKTDTSISNRQRGGERELERWQGEPGNGGGMDYSLGGGREGGAAQEKWDQFSANQRLFGIQTSFDEHQYTTALRKDTPEYRTRMEEAERIAKEIESRSALNANESAHVAEERGQEDSDEEALFSEVKRSTSSSKLNINAAEYIPAPPTPEKKRTHHNNSNHYQQQQQQPYYGTVYFNAHAYYPSMPQYSQDYYYYDDSDPTCQQQQFY